MKLRDRIVITGVGLTCPIGNSLPEFRGNLLEGRSGVSAFETRYIGPVLAGVCNYDELRYQKKKEVRRGTRAGSISIFCANEAVHDAGLEWSKVNRDRVGVYIGITEHGNVESENDSDMPMLWSDYYTGGQSQPLTKTQYHMMKQWKDGHFKSDWGKPRQPPRCT